LAPPLQRWKKKILSSGKKKVKKKKIEKKEDGKKEGKKVIKEKLLKVIKSNQK
jgi:hypothetical protein